MIFPKWKLFTGLSILLLSLATLIACNKAAKFSIPVPESDSETSSALYGSDDLARAKVAKIISVVDLESKDLDNNEETMEPLESEESVIEENSDLATQAVLAGVDGNTAYFRSDASTYQLWTHNQATNVKTNVYSSSAVMQSVAVTRDGNIVVASIQDASGFFDVYVFDNGNPPVNLTNTNDRDELDVSITAHGEKIVWSAPLNNGRIKINVCVYNSVGPSCTISRLGGNVNQRQASITGTGRYITLIRDLNNGNYRVLLYDVLLDTYTTVVSRSDELLHPSANDDGNTITYMRDRTAYPIGKYIVKMIDRGTGQISNELSSSTITHVNMANKDYIAYDSQGGSFIKAFTREIATNLKASAAAGNWNYGGVYWQWCPVAINIPDANLEAALRAEATIPNSGDISCTDMESLTSFSASFSNISDLTGLEYATNLTSLDFDNNNITDLTPIANLTNLTTLFLGANNITDITALTNLTNLTTLLLTFNSIADISPLVNLTNLESLNLGATSTTDISPLTNLTNLTTLLLFGNIIIDFNPLNDLINLTFLDLDNTNITGLAPLPLANLINLTTLRLDNNNITNITTIEDFAHRDTPFVDFEINDNCLEDNSVPTKGILAALQSNTTGNYDSSNNPKGGCPAIMQDNSSTYFDLPAATYNEFEDWSLMGGAVNLTHHSTGGRFDGFVEATDQTSDVWYWQAPEKYYGNASDYAGGLLSYWLKQSLLTSQVVFDDIQITGGGITLSYRFDNPSPGTDWTYYAVSLVANGWMNNNSASPASAGDMATVLANLTSLKIRGDYHAGNFGDTVGLDSVVMQRAYASSPALAIPDNTPAGVSDSIFITDFIDITELNVRLDISHTHMDDLIITLEHVDSNTSIMLLDLPTCGGGNDINHILSHDAALLINSDCNNTTPAYLANSIFQPLGNLTDFNNLHSDSEWKLTVSDNLAFDTGILDSWSLFFK